MGTLIFQIYAARCVFSRRPSFIAPIIYGVQTEGLRRWAWCGRCRLCGAELHHPWRGTEIIMRLLPPIVTGPVIIVIGLVLAPVG
ncbi:MAG: hypothetical protein ACLSTO_07595 [Bilophila wadsworthia]